MAIQIRFTSEHVKENGRYDDEEGREYRYVVESSGALAVYEKETGEAIAKDAAPIAVYGPHSWFSVSGDPRTKADDRTGRLTGF